MGRAPCLRQILELLEQRIHVHWRLQRNHFGFGINCLGHRVVRVAKATRLWNSTLLCFRFRMWRLWFARTSHSMTCKNICLVRHVLLFHPNYWVFYEDKHGFFLNTCRHETQSEHYRKRKRVWWITCWDLNRKHYTSPKPDWKQCEQLARPKRPLASLKFTQYVFFVLFVQGRLKKKTSTHFQFLYGLTACCVHLETQMTT